MLAAAALCATVTAMKKRKVWVGDRWAYVECPETAPSPMGEDLDLHRKVKTARHKTDTATVMDLSPHQAGKIQGVLDAANSGTASPMSLRSRGSSGSSTHRSTTPKSKKEQLMQHFTDARESYNKESVDELKKHFYRSMKEALKNLDEYEKECDKEYQKVADQQAQILVDCVKGDGKKSKRDFENSLKRRLKKFESAHSWYMAVVKTGFMFEKRAAWRSRVEAARAIFDLHALYGKPVKEPFKTLGDKNKTSCIF